MSTDEIINDALSAKAREKRYGRIETLVVGAVLLLAVIFGPIAYVATQRQEEIRNFSQQDLCIARQTAKGFAGLASGMTGIAAAFGTPPAPNVARSDTISQIDAAAATLKAAAEELKNVEKTCPGP